MSKNNNKTIYELILEGVGHLESKDGGFVIGLDREDFEQLMEWNGKIKNGTVKGGVAFAENGDKLELVWVSHEKEVEAEEEQKVEEKEPESEEKSKK